MPKLITKHEILAYADEHGTDPLGWRIYEVRNDDLAPWELREWVRSNEDHDYKRAPTLPGVTFNYKHYVRASMDAPGQIAYTPSDEYGEADRQIRQKIGKYLQKYHADLGAVEIARLAGRWRSKNDGKLTLVYANGPDEIEHMYRNGPRSCMSYALDCYQSTVHPTRAYGSEDIMGAYLTDGCDDIISRCLVNKVRNEYTHIYGDGGSFDEVLETELDTAGYVEGDLGGCRLLKLAQGNTWVVPYLDGDAADLAHHDSAHWVITTSGEYTAQTTEGLLEAEDMRTCGDCGERVHIDEAIYIESFEDMLCECCADRGYVWSHPAGQWVSRDDAVEFECEYYHEDELEYYDLVRDAHGDVQRESECVEDVAGDVYHEDETVDVWSCSDKDVVYVHKNNLTENGVVESSHSGDLGFEDQMHAYVYEGEDCVCLQGEKSDIDEDQMSLELEEATV